MEIDDEIFCTVIFALHLIQEKAVVSSWWKDVHKYWLTTERTKPAQAWLGKPIGSTVILFTGLLNSKPTKIWFQTEQILSF